MTNDNLDWVYDLHVAYYGRSHDRHYCYHRQISGYVKVILIDLLPYSIYHQWLTGRCEIRIVGYGAIAPNTRLTIADVAEKRGNRWKIKAKFTQ